MAVLSALHPSTVLKISIHKGISFKLIAILVACSLLLFANHLRKQWIAHTLWKSVVLMSYSGKREEAQQIYPRLYPFLKHNPSFLYNYGAELSIAGNYQESIKILEKVKSNLYNSDVFIYLGTNYLKTGETTKAEQAFLEANYIIPHRFIPKYRLVQLYHYVGDIPKALYYAQLITEMDVKVPSEIVTNIRDEMEKYVNNYSIGTD